MRAITVVVVGCALLSVQTLATASDPYVYPAKGQSAEQQSLDKAECYAFAKQQTGFDPMLAPTATSAAPEQRGSVIGGAARGALLGAAVGAIAGDTGEGAAMGAAAGGLMGGMRRNSSRRQEEAWEQEQAQIYAGNRDNYNRAFAACLEGRGYTTR